MKKCNITIKNHPMEVTTLNSKPTEQEIKVYIDQVKKENNVLDLTNVINQVIYQFYILGYCWYTIKEKR
jgi:hypothetical protein